nr:hypothetical protein [Saccharococcus thermophilus]
MKEALAKQFSNDIQAYINGKAAFVRETEKKALAWYKQKQ